eukprot:SAG11_NODE_30710_length_298_cov_1.025126_1_plen_36_part_01
MILTSPFSEDRSKEPPARGFKVPASRCVRSRYPLTA